MSTEILIIDDDPAIRDMLALYLRTQGYEATTVADGHTGLVYCAKAHPALVMCDLRMPGMNGLEVLAALIRDYPDLPVIVVSGTGEISDAIQALKLGASDYLTKPIEDLAVLDHAVDRSLERARLLAENRAYREHLEAANKRLSCSLNQLEEDEEHARRIQFALLPQRRMLFGDIECSSYLSTSAILSGDFVDYFSIDPEHFGFYMADVSGHGVSSAVITVLLKGYFSRYLENHRCYDDRTILDPALLLAMLNRDVHAAHHGKYLAMFYGVIDLSNAQMCYANGGQFPFPLLCDEEGVREIGGRSQPVGLFEDARYTDQQLQISSCFTLRVFSDGVLDALAPPDLQARKEQLRNLAADPSRDAEQLAQALGLNEQCVLPDDASVLSLRRSNGYG